MSRKTKPGPARAMDPVVLKNRIETALREGRKQQAVDFARALFDFAPEPANRALLVRATLDEAERLVLANQSAKAGPMASKLWSLVSSVEEKERLAEILARSGNFAWAWQLAQQLGNPILTSRIVGHTADAALRNWPILNSNLPADFQAHKEAIARAFAEAHAGHDDRARATLQVIGLGSPFLDWKVLVRGFLAWYGGDNARALENWQRLDPSRVPARLAAPFRAEVDPAYLAAQSAEARESLQELLDRAVGSGLASRLRIVKGHLADERQLGQAFRQAEQMLPRLQTDAPRLVPRLAACFFWAIVDRGYPEDLGRYRKVFGAPPEDPELNRLEALALERRHQFVAAHAAWESLEQSFANRAAALPPGQADRLRSLVWRHMAENADNMPHDQLHGRLRRGQRRFLNSLHSGLKPNAETCLKRSLELAPDQLELHFRLVHHYLEARQRTKALQAGKKLLKAFPDHAPTLELMGDLALEKQSYNDAVAFFRRAAEANPLDPQLRLKSSAAHAAWGQLHAEAKRFDRAREEFQMALDLREGAVRFPVLCHWAACEFLAANPNRAEELLEQAQQGQGRRLAVAFAMLVHAIRWKLKKPLKARFDAEFNQLLKEPFDAASAAALVAKAAAQRQTGIQYVGQKTHEKKVIAYLDKALHAELSEGQLQVMCQGLTELDSPKLLRTLFARGQQRFPANPHFYLAEIDYVLSGPSFDILPGRISHLLDKVRELASALPVGEREALQKMVQDREEEFAGFNPINDFFGFKSFDDFGDDDLDDDDPDEDYPDQDWNEF